MKVAAYARVSTDRQDLEIQLEEIRQSVALRGWEVVATYSDVASGAREDRADFRRLLADAARRRFDGVIVQRFDRAARSVRQLIDTLDHLRRCRVAFISLKEDVDTSTPAGELIFHVMAAIGQFERALIADRIRSGLARARTRGVHLGRRRAAARAEEALALRRDGLSMGQIARRPHCSRATIRRRLREIGAAGTSTKGEFQ